MKNADYARAQPLFAKVALYFGNCARGADQTWTKYNHIHWQARAEYYGGVSAYMMGQENTALAQLASARSGWSSILAASDVARPVDVATARASIAKLDSDLKVWDGTRAKGARQPVQPARDVVNCKSIVGEWRMMLPARPRSYRTVNAIMTVRDLGGNDYEGIVATPDWNFRLSFHEVRYSGPWKHGNISGTASIEVSVAGSTAEMRGTLGGMARPSSQGPAGLPTPSNESPSRIIGYKTCGV